MVNPGEDVRDYNNYGIDRHAYGIMVLIIILILYRFFHVIELCHVSCTIELEGKSLLSL